MLQSYQLQFHSHCITLYALYFMLKWLVRSQGTASHHLGSFCVSTHKASFSISLFGYPPQLCWVACPYLAIPHRSAITARLRSWRTASPGAAAALCCPPSSCPLVVGVQGREPGAEEFESHPCPGELVDLSSCIWPILCKSVQDTYPGINFSKLLLNQLTHLVLR